MNLEGKGWLIVVGVLLVLSAFLLVRDLQLSSQVKNLQQPSAAAPTQAPTTAPSGSPEPAPVETTSPTPSSMPDLSTPAGRDAARIASLKQIAAALGQYKQATGSYPAGLKLLIPKYLPNALTDPKAPQYSYRYQLTASGFKLTSVLETNQPADSTDADGRADKVYTLTERSQ